MLWVCSGDPWCFMHEWTFAVCCGFVGTHGVTVTKSHASSITLYGKTHGSWQGVLIHTLQAQLRDLQRSWPCTKFLLLFVKIAIQGPITTVFCTSSLNKCKQSIVDPDPWRSHQHVGLVPIAGSITRQSKLWGGKNRKKYGGQNSLLVVCWARCPAWCSVKGSILLCGEIFQERGFFPWS